MSRLMGFELLRRQILDEAEDFVSEIIGEWAEGDSEIERLFFAALALFVQYNSDAEHGEVLKASDPEHAGRMREWQQSKSALIIERQVQIDNYRVDFVISAWTEGRVWGGKEGPQDGAPRWRKLIVECDGHEFHERTKEQAARDRSRDRALTAFGYEVFRFTGSELWRDPLGCARQVSEWASKGI
jgi:very-short-patch-repair endonuclease